MQHAGVDGVHETAIPELKLYRTSAPTMPSRVLYEPSLCLIAQGAKYVMVGPDEHRYDPQRYLLVTADIPTTARVVDATERAPYLALRLRLDPLEVGELVAQLGPQEERPPACALAVNKLDPQLLDPVIRLMEMLPRARDARVLAPLARREITYRLLIGPQGARLRQLVAGDDQGQRITRTLRWLKAHYAEAMTVDALAELAGMSPSALHRHFRAVAGMSPLQYQKHLRLHEARRLMLSEALNADQACFRVGYLSPSQFSREYRRLFGAPPRRDMDALRRARERAGAAGPEGDERSRPASRVAVDRAQRHVVTPASA
jgi:AraC-like DNA-binding protein